MLFIRRSDPITKKETVQAQLGTTKIITIYLHKTIHSFKGVCSFTLPSQSNNGEQNTKRTGRHYNYTNYINTQTAYRIKADIIEH